MNLKINNPIKLILFLLTVIGFLIYFFTLMYQAVWMKKFDNIIAMMTLFSGICVVIDIIFWEKI